MLGKTVWAGMEMTTETILIFLILSACVLAALTVWVIRRLRKPRWRKSKGKTDVQVCTARVKNKVDSGADVSYNAYSYVVFDTADGRRMVFSFMDKAKYATLRIGDKGKLRYQGKAFISFEADPPKK